MITTRTRGRRKPVIVGVISDTHGLMRPEALAALAGVDAILHAGDVGAPEVLAALAELAPVTAVRGNNDAGAWADALPETAIARLNGAGICVIHDLATLALDPRATGLAAVVAGHSHKAAATVRDGVLYFNPGSAGPRRFRLPITLGRLVVSPAGAIEATIVPLVVETEQRSPGPTRPRPSPGSRRKTS